jgi:hypothetical protein
MHSPKSPKANYAIPYGVASTVESEDALNQRGELRKKREGSIDNTGEQVQNVYAKDKRNSVDDNVKNDILRDLKSTENENNLHKDQRLKNSAAIDSSKENKTSAANGTKSNAAGVLRDAPQEIELSTFQPLATSPLVETSKLHSPTNEDHPENLRESSFTNLSPNLNNKNSVGHNDSTNNNAEKNGLRSVSSADDAVDPKDSLSKLALHPDRKLVIIPTDHQHHELDPIKEVSTPSSPVKEVTLPNSPVKEDTIASSPLKETVTPVLNQGLDDDDDDDDENVDDDVDDDQDNLDTIQLSYSGLHDIPEEVSEFPNHWLNREQHDEDDNFAGFNDAFSHEHTTGTSPTKRLSDASADEIPVESDQEPDDESSINGDVKLNNPSLFIAGSVPESESEVPFENVDLQRGGDIVPDPIDTFDEVIHDNDEEVDEELNLRSPTESTKSNSTVNDLLVAGKDDAAEDVHEKQEDESVDDDQDNESEEDDEVTQPENSSLAFTRQKLTKNDSDTDDASTA